MPASDPPARELEIDYWSAVARRWRLVAGTAMLGVLIGTAVTPLIPPQYEATATVLVSRSRLSDEEPVSADPHVASFRAILQSSSLAKTVLDEFNLSAAPHRLTLRRFLRLLRIGEIRGTDLIQVGVRLSDPVLASKVANRLMALGVDLTERLNQAQAVRARDYIGEQLRVARTRLATADGELLRFKKENQIELLRKDAEALLQQRGRLLALRVDIEAETARLSKGQEELGKRPKIDTVMRSVDMDPALMEIVRRLGSDKTDILGLRLSNELVNPVHETLDRGVAESRTRLFSLESERRELVGRLQLDRPQPLLSDLYQREITLAQLETERELARSDYVNVETRFEQAKLQIVGRSPLMQAVDPALPPEQRVFPKYSVDAAVGALAGLLGSLAAAGVLGMRAKRRSGHA